MSERRYEHTESVAATLIALYPEGASALREIAEALIRQGKAMDALKYVERLPVNVLGERDHARLGFLLAEVGRGPESYAIWRQLEEPEDPTRYRQLNDKFFASVPEPRNLAALSFNWLMAIGHLDVRYEEQLFYYGEAVRRSPQSPTANLRLGGVLYNLGRYAEAIPHYEVAAQRGTGEVKANGERLLRLAQYREEALRGRQ